MSGPLSFVLLNESGQAPLAPQLTHDWLAKCAAAVEVQLNRDVASHWGGDFAVRAGEGPSDVLPGEIPFRLKDAIPVVGAVADHDVDVQGAPDAELSLEDCSTLDDVSIAISHECCETAGDPACNEWCDDGEGHEWAKELCDAVESTSYDIDGIKVSDFLLPAFFAPMHGGPFSYCSHATAPFQTGEGGYQVVRVSGTNETSVSASGASRRGMRAHHGRVRVTSRAARRGVRAP
jgi:hypothetical protein